MKCTWKRIPLQGGRRPSTRSLPLQVDPSFAGSLLTEAGRTRVYSTCGCLMQNISTNQVWVVRITKSLGGQERFADRLEERLQQVLAEDRS